MASIVRSLKRHIKRSLKRVQAAAVSDTTPDAFAFEAIDPAGLNQQYVSNSVIPTGFTNAAALTVPAGVEYDINDADTWSSDATLFLPGDSIRIRATSSAANATTTTPYVTIGDVQGVMSLTTAAALIQDTTPSIAGTATQGETLTHTPGTYSGGGAPITVTRQWFIAGTPDVEIDAATALTLVLSSATAGENVFSRETAVDVVGQTIVTDSNQIGPITALTTGATYPFNETAGTLLKDIPDWEVMTGDEAAHFSVNASGKLSKNSTSVSPGVLAETGGGASVQSIQADWEAASSIVYMGTLISLNATGGIEGYVVYRSSDTVVRLRRMTNSSTSTNLLSWTVASGVPVTLKLETVVGASDTTLTVSIDGVAQTPYVDSAGTRKTFGRVGLIYVNNSAQSGILDNIVTAASSYNGGTGVAQNASVRLGRAQVTGGVGAINASLSSLGLLASGEASYWEFVKLSTTGGDASTDGKFPAVVSGPFTPTPTSNLADTDGGAAIVYSARPDGEEQGVTLTINVQPGAETDAVCCVASNTQLDLIKAAYEAAGGRIEIMEEARDSFGDWAGYPAAPVTLDKWTGVSPIIITTKPGATLGVPCIRVKGCTNVHVHDAVVKNNLLPYPAIAAYDEYHATLNPGGATTRANVQNRSLIDINISETGGVFPSSNCTVKRCIVGSFDEFLPDPNDLATYPGYPNRWYSGVSVGGSASDLTKPATGVVIGSERAAAVVDWLVGYWPQFLTGVTPMSDGNFLRGVKDGFAGGNMDGVTYRGNAIRDFCSNSLFQAGIQLKDVTTVDNIFVDGWLNPNDVGDHPDFMQKGGTGMQADVEQYVDKRNVLLVVWANNHSQGPFDNDASHHNSLDPFVPPYLGPWPGANKFLKGSSTKRFTGFRFIDCDTSNDLLNCGSSVAILIGLCNNRQIHQNTLVRGKGQYAPPQVDPSARGGSLTAEDDTVYASTGDATGNIWHGDAGLGGVTKADNAVLGSTGITGGYSVENEAARVAFYLAQGFADPGNDNPIMAAAPAVDGAFKRVDGSYRGAINPDLTWAGTPWTP